MRPSPEELEQEAAFLKGLAAVVWSYYAELVARGFSEDQALHLAGEWQALYCESLYADED